MDKQYYFERNLLALSQKDPDLCARLSVSETTLNRYKFVDARNGDCIPAYVDKDGAARPLHSLIAPEKEAERICAQINGEGYIIMLGFGAAYSAAAALKKNNVHHVLVIDYGIDGFAEILCSRDFAPLFNDAKFYILIDPLPSEIEAHILGSYNPCLHGGIKTIPLRARTDFDTGHFLPASDAIKSAIDKVSADYSVQVFFGKRWFSNMLRNIFIAEKQSGVIQPVRRAAICAAGPSLDAQLATIQKRRNQFYLIATDTSLGSLFNAGIKPDAIISIDCQHISYCHFIGLDISDIPLFLDLASPPLLARLSKRPFFFSGAHPLCAYINKFFRQFPKVDSSGGNVSYAALSLAEKLGAKEIELYGADFSYPQGNVYTRGAYFYPYFNRRQNRFGGVETHISKFLYKTPSLKRVDKNDSWYYETRPLQMYRKKFEEKASAMKALMLPEPGGGAEICISKTFEKPTDAAANFLPPYQLFSAGPLINNARDFLYAYRERILNLDDDCLNYDNDLEKLIWTSLLPTAAAIKYRNPDADIATLSQSVKQHCIGKIERLAESPW